MALLSLAFATLLLRDAAGRPLFLLDKDLDRDDLRLLLTDFERELFFPLFKYFEPSSTVAAIVLVR